MIVNNEENKSKALINWKIKLLILFIYFVLIFVVESFFRDNIMEFSINIIQIIQQNTNHSILILASILSQIGTNIAFLTILIVIFSLTNIFKSYLLLMIVIINNFITGSLKLIYKDGRPFYYSENKVIPYKCYLGFGNPSGNTLCALTFYLTLWHIMFNSRNMVSRYIMKMICLVFVVIINLVIITTQLVVGTHSLNQLIFGVLISLGIFFFLFWLLEINTNDSYKLLSIINMKLIYYLLVNVLILVIMLCLIYFREQLDDKHRELWSKIIKSKCQDYNENQMFEKEEYFLFGSVFSNIFAFIGLRHEFIYTFRSKVNNWIKYNFSIKGQDEDSLLSSLDLTKDTQWNHNNILNSILRLLVIGLITMVITSPYFLISNNNNFWLILFVKIIAPFSIVLYFNFFMVKLILKYLRLVNFSSNNLLSGTE